MRHLILVAAAVMLFALIAAPAMAKSHEGDTEDQPVTVEVDSCLCWQTCQNPIHFHIRCEDYEKSCVYADNLPTGHTSLEVWSNIQWAALVSTDAYANGMPANYILSIGDTGAQDGSGNWIALSGVPIEILDNMAPTNYSWFEFWYKICGFTPADDWAGVHNFDITYTVVAD